MIRFISGIFNNHLRYLFELANDLFNQIKNFLNILIKNHLKKRNKRGLFGACETVSKEECVD
jgi:hypothetical protein